MLSSTRIAITPPFVRDPLWLIARQVPALDLNFAKNKSLVNAKGESLVTFTRASSATYVAANGLIETAATNVPRFDHNSTTGESLGLLVEEQRTNLCLQSAAISTSPWGPNGTETCVASTLTDPAGGLNAFKINFVGSGAFERWQQAITVVNGTTYTLSAWIRSTSGTASFRLRFGAGVTSSDLTATTTWQRFTFTLIASVTGGFFAFNAPSTGAAAEIHVWGAQLEAGAFPTSYIPTTTAAVTRSADVAVITGANFSSWFNASEGTVFAEAIAQPFTATTFPRIVGIDRGDGSANFATLARSNGVNRFEYSVFAPTGQAVGLQPPVTFTANSTVRAAYVYKADDFIAAANGVLSIADTSGSVPTALTTLGIGMSGNATMQYNGTIRRITYWPTRLPNTTLQQVTK
jgi:hypothetical protein